MFGRRRSAAVLDRDISISEAGAKAAETVNELADRALALAREAGTSDVTTAARTRLADASERLADAVRPKPKTHRIRRVLIVGAVAGGVVGLIRSPLRGKISERLFGPPAEDEPGSITLPYDEKADSGSDSIELRAEAVPPAPVATEANGGSSSPASETADTSRA